MAVVAGEGWRDVEQVGIWKDNVSPGTLLTWELQASHSWPSLDPYLCWDGARETPPTHRQTCWVLGRIYVSWPAQSTNKATPLLLRKWPGPQTRPWGHTLH